MMCCSSMRRWSTGCWYAVAVTWLRSVDARWPWSLQLPSYCWQCPYTVWASCTDPSAPVTGRHTTILQNIIFRLSKNHEFRPNFRPIISFSSAFRPAVERHLILLKCKLTNRILCADFQVCRKKWSISHRPITIDLFCWKADVFLMTALISTNQSINQNTFV